MARLQPFVRSLVRAATLPSTVTGLFDIAVASKGLVLLLVLRMPPFWLVILTVLATTIPTLMECG